MDKREYSYECPHCKVSTRLTVESDIATEIGIVRAFVERVLNKYDDAKLATELPWEQYLEEVLRQELAAMEKPE
jgi:hypothetical protein